jgi:hypothetical protein
LSERELFLTPDRLNFGLSGIAFEDPRNYSNDPFSIFTSINNLKRAIIFMNKLPKARTENIVVQTLNDEVLIYDTITNQAFCLNETSARVFNHCDGQTSFDELQRKYQFTGEIIFLALDELKKQNLLASDAEYASPFAGMHRREVIRKVGFATMIALPLISSIVAPAALSAASGAAATCIPGGRGIVYCPAACRAGGTVSLRQYRNGGGVCNPAGGFFGDLTANCGPGGNDVGRTSTIDLSIISNNC